jgi:uncharacterized protein YyaL (SSP411 family)
MNAMKRVLAILVLCLPLPLLGWAQTAGVTHDRSRFLEELKDYLRRQPRQGLTVLVKTPENAAALAELAPFTANYPVPEEGTRYYLCSGGTCRQPVSSIEKLE